MTAPRILIGSLALSAFGLVGLVAYEGYSSKAVPPVPGDVPTYGFGSTRDVAGAPLQGGETISPPAALALAARDIRVKEGALKDCLEGVALTQGEYDAFVSLAYNVGAAALCRSSIPGKLKRGEFEAACRTILDFKRVQGKDCCAPQNKSFCGGVCSRRRSEYETCIGGGNA